jgi:hypothetical protein
MDPSKNPYTPGAGAKPTVFVGRDAEIEDFRTTLLRLRDGQAARSQILYGLRGVGKTVLLDEFDLLAREQDWVTSSIECNEDDRLGPLIARLCHRALRHLSRGRRMSDAVKKATGALKAFVWTLDPDSGRMRFNIDIEAAQGVADSGDLEADIVELLSEVGRAALDGNSGALFLLDEMQVLEKSDLALLMAALQRVAREQLPVMLVGAGLPQLPLTLTKSKAYAERLFVYQEIGGLSDADAARALKAPASRRGVQIDRDALQFIVERSGGYPFFLQQWGETAWEEAIGEDRITLDDALAAEEAVSHFLETRFFKDRYDRASEAERIYMSAMADLGPDGHSSREIADKMGVALSKVSVARAGLLDKGLIFNPVDSDLAFTVPQFDAYVRRVHPFDPEERPRLGRPRRS